MTVWDAGQGIQRDDVGAGVLRDGRERDGRERDGRERDGRERDGGARVRRDGGA
jgi:hypothetical protein